MKPFDYISVLLSFVISMVFAQVLTGISHLINSGVRRPVTPLWYWIGCVLFYCVDYWFSIWGLRDHRGWSFGYVCSLLVFAASLFLVGRAVVPDAPQPEPIDVTAFYERHRRRILALFFVFSAIGTIANLTLPGFATSELFGLAVVLMILLVIAWRWARPAVQWAVVAGNFVLTSYYVIHYEPLL